MRVFIWRGLNDSPRSREGRSAAGRGERFNTSLRAPPRRGPPDSAVSALKGPAHRCRAERFCDTQDVTREASFLHSGAERLPRRHLFRQELASTVYVFLDDEYRIGA